MNYNLGKMISKARKDKNLSQSALADKLHVSRQTISKWENNTSVPDHDSIKDLCKELDLKLEVFEKILWNYSIEDKKRKTNKVMFIILGIIIIIGVFLFMLVKYKNKFEVYKVSIMENNVIKMTNGVFIKSNVNYYLQFGEITLKNEDDIKNYKIKLYYKKDNDYRFMADFNANETLVLNEKNGYGEYFGKHFDQNNVYIDLINKSDNKVVNSYKLNFKLLFRDSKMFYFINPSGALEDIDWDETEDKDCMIEKLNKIGYKYEDDYYVKETKDGSFIYYPLIDIFYFKKDNLFLQYNVTFNKITGKSFEYNEKTMDYEYDFINKKLKCNTGTCDNYEEYNKIIMDELNWLFDK